MNRRERIRFFFYGYGNSDRERRYHLLMRLIWLHLLIVGVCGSAIRIVIRLLRHLDGAP